MIKGFHAAFILCWGGNKSTERELFIKKQSLHLSLLGKRKQDSSIKITKVLATCLLHVYYTSKVEDINKPNANTNKTRSHTPLHTNTLN